MRLLMVDNYDSFTYNLVQYFGELAADCDVWRNDTFSLDQVHDLQPDGIVISPGPRTPAEAGQSLPVIHEFGGHIPILGVCLGHQAIGAAFGARIGRARKLMHGKTSSISHDGTGVFRDLPDPLTVTRYHSLVVTDVPAELRVSATADDDGQTVVMGLSHAQKRIYGVQFHPESILTESGHQLLQNFLDICREA